MKRLKFILSFIGGNYKEPSVRLFGSLAVHISLDDKNKGFQNLHQWPKSCKRFIRSNLLIRIGFSYQPIIKIKSSLNGSNEIIHYLPVVILIDAFIRHVAFSPLSWQQQSLWFWTTPQRTNVTPRCNPKWISLTFNALSKAPGITSESTVFRKVFF